MLMGTTVIETHLYLMISKTFSEMINFCNIYVTPYVSSIFSIAKFQMHIFIQMKSHMRYQLKIKTISHSTCLQRILQPVQSIISNYWTWSNVNMMVAYTFRYHSISKYQWKFYVMIISAIHFHLLWII